MGRSLFVPMLLGSALFLGGCGDSSSYVYTGSCEMEAQLGYVSERLHDQYFWYNYVKDVDLGDYNDTLPLLDAMKYAKLDRWSYITTQVSYDNYYVAGTYYGHGYASRFVDDRLFISYVYDGSPAQKAGFKRGVEILAINDRTVNEISDENLWGTILGEDAEGVENKFIVVIDGTVVTVTIQKEEINANSVTAAKIIEQGGTKYAYMVLNKFIEPTAEELTAAFAYFKKENAKGLILDLRYNGGGRLSVANLLVNLIGGDNTADKLFLTLDHNDKYQVKNTDYLFASEANALGLDTVYVITTDETCSASEAVINGLRPFVNVVTIGGTTCGKPVGMYGYTFCDKHLSMIEFETVNADGEGQYYEGIGATCEADDDLFHDFGDTDEGMLSQTLYYIDTKSCKEIAAKSAKTIRSKNTDPLLSGFAREIGAF